MLSVLPYDEVRPSGQIMALGVMRHKNKYVVKKGIQLYERWNSKEGIKMIKTLHFEETRFQKYAEQVIENILKGMEHKMPFLVRKILKDENIEHIENINGEDFLH